MRDFPRLNTAQGAYWSVSYGNLYLWWAFIVGIPMVPRIKQMPFKEKISEEFKWFDIMFLMIIPTTLFFSYNLPMALRRQFLFNLTSPSLLTAFLSHYIHLDTWHFVSNILSYTTTSTLVYFLTLSNYHRLRLYPVYAASCLFLPIPLSYLNLLIPRYAVTFGFSGINMALLGYASVEFMRYIDINFTKYRSFLYAPLLFFINSIFIASQYRVPYKTYVIILISVIGIIIYGATMLNRHPLTPESIDVAVDKQGYFELFLLATIYIATFVILAFPRDISVDGGHLNVYIHFIGYTTGFISTYITTVLMGHRSKSEI